MNKIILLCLALNSAFVVAQPESTDWYFDDPATSPYYGIGVDQLYEYIGDATPSTQVIVAILDSGVDIEHDDLKANIWVNTDEIPDNKIDDDQNGYIDDVNGWNFLGNANGENVTKETLEVTRLYAHYKKYFEGKELKKLSKKDAQLYADFLEYERVVMTEREEAQSQIAELDHNVAFIEMVLDTFDAYYENQELNEEFLERFDPGDHEYLKIAKEVFKNAKEYGLELTTTDNLLKEIEASYAEVGQQSKDMLDYRFNPDLNSRKIIGDNYEDQEECCYGNNNVRGGFAFHGTHVAGIVGAIWNDMGVNGVAKHVVLMPVRTVPNGDEHDKDVANAIRYAVDNGADVINMSFGKGQSWNKKVVDDATRYARKHDVLLIHGCGNDGANNEVSPNFPNQVFERKKLFGKKYADNWIEVGASGPEKDEHLIAPFSNYGKTTVDLFAPGMFIYSTAPDDAYEYAQGTSMSSPVVAGVAAIIRAYFPELKASEVKDVLLQSVTPVDKEVVRPGDGELVNATELSKTGGVINAYEAFRIAEQKTKRSTKQQVKAEKA